MLTISKEQARFPTFPTQMVEQWKDSYAKLLKQLAKYSNYEILDVDIQIRLSEAVHPKLFSFTYPFYLKYQLIPVNILILAT